MANEYVGFLLLGIGIVFDLVGLYFYVITSRKANGVLESLKTSVKAANFQDILDAIGKILEYFSKLTTPVQIAVLGSFHIAAGLYLLVKKPF